MNCEVSGCDRQKHAKGYCSTHYRRYLANGDPTILIKIRGICSVTGCDRPHTAKGYCDMHYRRLNRTGCVNAEVKSTSCSVADCYGSIISKGYCQIHYQRWSRHGSTNDPRPSLSQRFWAKVSLAPALDCWLWTGSIDDGGYGRIALDGTAMFAHRIAFELMVCDIPDGLQLDHLCHSNSDCNLGNACLHRKCVNPYHLEPVSQLVNIRRAKLRSANALKTHCIRGHEFTEANTYINRLTGNRSCKACAAKRSTVREST